VATSGNSDGGKEVGRSRRLRTPARRRTAGRWASRRASPRLTAQDQGASGLARLEARPELPAALTVRVALDWPQVYSPGVRREMRGFGRASDDRLSRHSADVRHGQSHARRASPRGEPGALSHSLSASESREWDGAKETQPAARTAARRSRASLALSFFPLSPSGILCHSTACVSNTFRMSSVA
jgi:hypothetical protein